MHYRLRKVRRRTQVVDAHNEQHVLGVVYGSDRTGFEACRPGGDVMEDTDVFPTVEAAAVHIYLEFLATLELTTTPNTPTIEETS